MRRQFFFYLGALVIAAVPAWAGPRVLVIHSYEPTYAWTQRIQAAIDADLTQAGIAYSVVYMDTKRRPTMEQIQQAARKAKRKIAEIKPAVVIAVDDSAQKYVVADYLGDSAIQFVFCGVNAEPATYGYPAANVTGLLERTYPRQALRMLKILIPATLTAACLTDDSPTSDQEVARIQTLAQNGTLPAVVVDYHQPVTWSQWTDTVSRIDTDPRVDAILVLLFHTVKANEDGKTLDPTRVITWTVAHTQKPVVGLWASTAEHGALCSVVVDPREHGRTAAQMTLAILNGTRAGDIPIKINQEGFAILNLRSPAAQRIDPTVDELMVADQVIR